MNAINEMISALKKERNALILAHYYQTREIREIADHVCDSFEMARLARDAAEELLIICGVRFMAESAKIFNPGKTVLLPSQDAGCPMADMITPGDVRELRGRYPDAAVICYVNSSCAVKAACDVCCTSSSAVKIARSIPEQQVIFVPDRNLGAYVGAQVPEKEIILFDGCCPIHDRITEEDVILAEKAHPGAKLLAHPECRGEVLEHALYVGSTAGIIKEAMDSDCGEFIIGTETEIAVSLAALIPDKSFYPLKSGFLCADMKKTGPADVLNSLKNTVYEVLLSEDEMDGARKCLERMIELG